MKTAQETHGELIDAILAKLDHQQATLDDIKTICRNHDVYDSKTLARVIEQRINRKDTQ
jgi:hypothetical protein